MSPTVIPVELAHAYLAMKRQQVSSARAADPWRQTARANQVTPAGSWTVWLRMAGRGEGKTRSGAEFIREEVMAGRMQRIAFVARTAADARDVMVEGESGILACCERYLFDAKYEPSRRRVVFGNGARAYLYSAEEPNLLRGPQHDGYWADEVAAWKKPDTWDQLQFGMRLKGPLGNAPRGIATTTPRPTKVILKILKRAGLALSTGTTYDNRANLAESFFEEIISQYEGTRLGRQELMGELLNALEGALWSYDQLDALRVEETPELTRIVVAIDPPASDGPHSAECGIVVAGTGRARDAYVLDDRSLRGSPNEWALAAWAAADHWNADALVYEMNQGGNMVERILRSARDQRPGPARRLIGVRATKGKILRAEPVAALYEQRKVWHAGTFGKLEDQQCTFLPEEQARQRKDETGEGQASPDRLDACLIAGTLVTTARGDVPIERVVIGDLVLTRYGWNPVVNAGMTSAASPVQRVEFSNGESLTGTGNHPVWVHDRGFVPLDTLVCGDIIETCKSMMKRSSFRAFDTHADRIHRTSISNVISGPRAKVGGIRCTEISGRLSMARSRRAMTSTMTMGTRSTTTSQTLCLSRSKSTRNDTQRNSQSSAANTLPTSARLHLHGIALLRAGRGIVNLVPKRGKGERRIIRSFVRIVAKRLIPTSRGAENLGIAAATAIMPPPMRSTDTMLRSRVRCAERPSGKANTGQSPKPAPVSVVQRYESGVAPVYNLTVAETPEYFANGVLVHNCVWAITELLVKQSSRQGGST